MVILHSRFRYAGPPKFGGRLRPDNEVLHLVSDAPGEGAQRAELRRFVVAAGLPRSLLNNPHFLGPGRPHLDVWGKPARKAARLLGPHGPGHRESAASGRTERDHQVRRFSTNSRTSTCIPRTHPPQCVTSGRPGTGVGSEERNGGEEEA